jgi:hypothetical protein
MFPHGCEDVLIIVLHIGHIHNQCPFLDIGLKDFIFVIFHI